MSETLACTGADDTFEASLESEGREEPSIALTYMPLVIVDSGVDAFTVPAKKFLVS